IYDGRLVIDDLTRRMRIGLDRTLRDSRIRLTAISARLKPYRIQENISNSKLKHKQLILNMLKSIVLLIRNNKWKNEVLVSRLKALNPMAVLDRGYSITRKLPQRSIIMDTRQVDINDQVEITLASGTLTGRIEGKDGDGA
nr:exodeoxyribonuclease VII large subunit [Desulfobacterales bacterium]